MRRRFVGLLRRVYLCLEDRPIVVVLVAGLVTVGVVLVLAWQAGWSRVAGLVSVHHPWAWLGVCVVGELVAYGGYVLTVRDVARVDGGVELGLAASVRTVVAGFGVFAATRLSGGFTVDYWAFRDAGAAKREAARRVLGLGFLEYTVLSVSALVASVLLFFRLDGHRSPSVTLPALIIVPVLAVALWLTSPKRADRLSRPRRGRLRGLFADSVAAATIVRKLLESPRDHALGVFGTVVYSPETSCAYGRRYASSAPTSP